MATLKTISAALKLIDMKKENLRKAFEGLQAHSSSLSSFSLTWSDLDSHFTSIQSSLEHKFKLLQSEESQSQPQPLKSPPNPQQPSSPSVPPQQSGPSPKPQQPTTSSSVVNAQNSSNSASVPARPELKSLCQAMDGLGLLRYILQRSKQRNTIKVELADAVSCAPDAAAMVLDAMGAFYMPNLMGDNDEQAFTMRMGCVFLLEVLMKLKAEIKPEVRERARNLAMEWKGKANADVESPWEALGFLSLLATYRLVDELKVEELIDYAVAIARFRQAVELYRVLGLGDRITDIIQKLISIGKHLLAIKLIFEFELSGKFPPVSLLEDHVKQSKKLAQEVLKVGDVSLQLRNEAILKEVSALKAAIKCIEEYKLESQYPKEDLVKLIANLEKKTRKKRPQPVIANASKSQQHLKVQKQNGSKHPRVTPPAGSATIHNSNAAATTGNTLLQQPYLSAALLPERAALSSSPAGPYDLPGSIPADIPYGSTPAVAQYGLTSVPHYGFTPADRYGMAETSVGFPGNQTPLTSHQYRSESQVPPAYSDTHVSYGGYGVPEQYHPAYYPS